MTLNDLKNTNILITSEFGVVIWCITKDTNTVKILNKNKEMPVERLIYSSHNTDIEWDKVPKEYLNCDITEITVAQESVCIVCNKGER